MNVLVINNTDIRRTKDVCKNVRENVLNGYGIVDAVHIHHKESLKYLEQNAKRRDKKYFIITDLQEMKKIDLEDIKEFVKEYVALPTLILSNQNVSSEDRDWLNNFLKEFPETFGYVENKQKKGLGAYIEAFHDYFKQS